MSLINDLRLDIGDDDNVVYPSSVAPSVIPIVITPCANSLIADLRIDVGDDESILPTGADINVTLPSLSGSCNMSMVTNLRVDVADDDNILDNGSSIIVISGDAPTSKSLVTAVRVDIGDDAIVSGVIRPDIQCPEIYCTTEVTGSSYTIEPTDVIIYVNPTINAITTINLPGGPIEGQKFVIKDKKGIANTYPIVVDPGLNTIDGLDAWHISTNYASIHIMWMKTQWHII